MSNGEMMPVLAVTMPMLSGFAFVQSPATAEAAALEAAGAALEAAGAAEDAAGAAEDDDSDDVVLLEQPARSSPAAAATPIQPLNLIPVSPSFGL
jgi:hypothetical protein